MTNKTKKTSLIIAILIALIALLGLTVSQLDVGQRLISLIQTQYSALNSFIEQHPIVASLAFWLFYTIVVIFSLPAAGVLTLVAGLLFGGLWGGLLSWSAAVIGATLLFIGAKSYFGEMFRAKAGSWVDKLKRGFHKNEFSYLLLLRLNVLVPFFVLNVVPAFLNVRLHNYIIATALGIAPATFVKTYLTAGLKLQFIQDGTLNKESILTMPSFYIPLLLLAVIAVIPILYKKFARKNMQEPR